MKKLTRKNPNDIYSSWLDLSSKDKSKARKAALALKSQLSSKKSSSDFWPIIREERDLTVDEIKAKIESVIKKTSGVRVNPENEIERKLKKLLMKDVFVYESDDNVFQGQLKYSETDNLFKVKDIFITDNRQIIKFSSNLVKYIIGNRIILLPNKKRSNPQTIFGFFPFETKLSPFEIESLILHADEINDLEKRGRHLTADKKLHTLEIKYGPKLAHQVVAWRKYNKY